MVETSWKDSAKAKVDSLVEEAGESDEDHAELVALLRATLHTLNRASAMTDEVPVRKIIRLTDVAAVNGKYLYRCNGCGSEDRGNDRDRNHMQWRERHWANCWPD